jgi:enterochelin esterase-like enzyme
VSYWGRRAATSATVGGVLLVAINIGLAAAFLPGSPTPDAPVASPIAANPSQQILGATQSSSPSPSPLSPPTGAAATAKPSPTAPHPTATPSTSQTALAGGRTPRPAPKPGKTLVVDRPWLSWRTSGQGTVWMANLPAPWTEGTATTENVDVYTPPGYQSSGSRRYPVLYQAPFDYPLWESTIGFRSYLDTLINQGVVPPMIVVFINAWRAPIWDTECANSVDGRQWFDTFISKTVVSYIDANYRTDARPEARGLFGFSQGAYCAAILALRHPTVFTTSIPISGYYRAGEGDPSSRLPFGGYGPALAAASPMVVATQLAADVRSKLLFIVVAKPDDPFFGVAGTDFERLLGSEGYPLVSVDSAQGHGWDQVRRELPFALAEWGACMGQAGVFTTG